MIARMWEVRALGSGFDELLSWVCDQAIPLRSPPEWVKSVAQGLPSQTAKAAG